MAGKTMIGGVAYDIKAGKTMIGGVAYDIKAGKTLVNGVAYDIKFGAEPLVIFQAGDRAIQNGTMGLRNGCEFVVTGTRKGMRLKPTYDSEGDYFNGAFFNIGAEPTGSGGIDITEYNTLHIQGYRYGPVQTGSIAKVGLNTANVTGSKFVVSQSVPTGTETELSFDLSSLAGKYYIRAYYDDEEVYMQSVYGMYITSIYLD